MATRPGPVPVTAAVVADVLLAALGIVGGPAVRSTIGAGTSSPPPIPLLVGVVTTVLGADTVAGYGHVDPTGLASLTLAAVGQVVSGVTGTLDLYDLTAAAVVATLTWTETAPTRKTAAVAVPGSARLYELRVRKSGGGDADYALFSAVSLIGG